MHLYIISLLLLSSVSAHAEVYRWTDSNGKVHFSDKKPAEKAENISDKVKQQNIDTSTAEHQKMEAIFRKENDADREYKRQQLLQQQPSQESLQLCAEAKSYLRDITGGAVIYYDDDGKAVKVSMEEHKKKIADTQKYIKDHCSQ